MNWDDERYVRLYTRDTADLLAVGWEGRLVFYELFRKVDRAGTTDYDGDPGLLAELLRVPHDVCERGLDRLLARGCVEASDGQLVIPNFIEAQEAKQSDKLRQQESRARRRDAVRATVTKRDAGVTKRDETSRAVTACHSSSQPVTPSLAVPSRDVPNCDNVPADQRPGSDHARFVDYFDTEYRKAHGGAKPTWGSKQGAQVKRLLKAHGLDECLRRTRVLFTSPPPWIQSRDLATLVQHFDKLVVRRAEQMPVFGRTE